MAEITHKRRGELLRGIFKILKAHPDGLQAKHVLSKLEEVVPPTEFEDTNYPSNPNQRRFEKIARFTTIPTVKAGWLVKEKGNWSLTEEGLKAFESLTDPENFAKEAFRLYKEWKQGQPVPDVPEGEEDANAATTLEEAEESAWASIEEHLLTMNPYDFQDLVAGLLQGMGYHIAWISPPGPDRGIDIIAHTNPLGIEGPRIKVQVKRRSDKIAVDGVRSFMAILGDGDIGLFVSAGGFTKEAELEVRTQEKRKLTLLGLKKLFDLWVEHYYKIPENRRKLLPLQPVYFLSPKK